MRLARLIAEVMVNTLVLVLWRYLDYICYAGCHFLCKDAIWPNIPWHPSLHSTLQCHCTHTNWHIMMASHNWRQCCQFSVFFSISRHDSNVKYDNNTGNFHLKLGHQVWWFCAKSMYQKCHETAGQHEGSLWWWHHTAWRHCHKPPLDCIWRIL